MDAADLAGYVGARNHAAALAAADGQDLVELRRWLRDRFRDADGEERAAGVSTWKERARRWVTVDFAEARSAQEHLVRTFEALDRVQSTIRSETNLRAARQAWPDASKVEAGRARMLEALATPEPAIEPAGSRSLRQRLAAMVGA